MWKLMLRDGLNLYGVSLTVATGQLQLTASV